MKKVVYGLCVAAALYLAMHMVVFALNAPYRARLQNPDYINGRCSVTYYSWGF